LSVLYTPDHALVDAVFLSDTDDVRRLLGEGADPDARDESQRPALMLATAEGDVASARLLLEAGADPNLRDADGWTALEVAVSHRRVHLVRLLVQFGAAPDRRSDSSGSVLLRALCAGHAGAGLAATMVGLARCLGDTLPLAPGRVAN
jgi:uncharacterized protein